jgi:glycosyltransferase involved in cell wall biosynthesis
LRTWISGPYDLVWFSQVDGFVALDGCDGIPTVVDLVDLDDGRLQHRMTAIKEDRAAGRVSRMRHSPAYALVRRLTDPVDIRRWRSLQQRVLARADVVTVCSELDRSRLSAANVEVLPNAYDVPASGAVGRNRAHAGPVLLMVGVLAYEPNSDGAWWFADAVLPLVQAVLPDVEFRVVGRPHASVADLARRKGVVLPGFVDVLETEFAVADIVVVPLRSGGGTRVKIIEAFAYGVPVVSTSVGCEGLAVVNGEHLLIADEAHEFADACLRVLGDDVLRRHLVESGCSLFDAKYSLSSTRARVTEIVDRATRAGNATRREVDT